jgi:hypothetical protein
MQDKYIRLPDYTLLTVLTSPVQFDAEDLTHVILPSAHPTHHNSDSITMSFSQNPSQCLEPSADDRIIQDRPSRTLTSHGGTQEASQHGSYDHDDSLSIERLGRVHRYRSRYVQARAEFSRDPAPDSFFYLRGSAESTIESFSKLLEQERSTADDSMIGQAREGLRMWPVFLAFVKQTKPAETVSEALMMKGKETLATLEKELLNTVKNHKYPTDIQSLEDWKIRLVTAAFVAQSSLEEWTSSTLGEFFDLHLAYLRQNTAQYSESLSLLQGPGGRQRTGRRSKTIRGSRVEKRQKRG